MRLARKLLAAPVLAAVLAAGPALPAATARPVAAPSARPPALRVKAASFAGSGWMEANAKTATVTFTVPGLRLDELSPGTLSEWLGLGYNGALVQVGVLEFIEITPSGPLVDTEAFWASCPDGSFAGTRCMTNTFIPSDYYGTATWPAPGDTVRLAIVPNPTGYTVRFTDLTDMTSSQWINVPYPHMPVTTAQYMVEVPAVSSGPQPVPQFGETGFFDAWPSSHLVSVNQDGCMTTPAPLTVAYLHDICL